jgi:hypothetical protein
MLVIYLVVGSAGAGQSQLRKIGHVIRLGTFNILQGLNVGFDVTANVPVHLV